MNTMTQPPSEPAAWLDRMLRWALLLVCGIALSKGLADPDFWGHVQYGRDVLASGLPSESNYNYTAVGYRWINHENLAELAFALGVDWLGPGALLLLKCLAGIGTLWLVLRVAERQGVGQVAAYTGALLVAANMMLFWTLRPQLFSFVYFTAMIALIDRAFSSWQPAHPAVRETLWKLAPCVPLFALWTNTHGGFIAGWCVLVALLGLRGIESLLALRRAGSIRAGSCWQVLFGFGAFAFCCGLATLLNPYGVELHQWLMRSLGEARPEIIEWRPPELTLPWAPFWALVAAIAASVCGARGRRDWAQLAVVGLTLWQSLEHRRHVVFLSLLFGFWMLPYWDSMLKRLGIGRDERTIGESLTGSSRRAFGIGLAGVLALLGATLFQQVRQIPVRHDNYPVDAFQFITEQQLEGRLLSQLRWGQYAIAAFGKHPDAPAGTPRLDVAFDGRFRTCYPQSVVDQYFDFAEGVDSRFRNRSPDSPPANETALLNREPRPNLVLIDRAMPNAVKVMHGEGDRWVLLYQDRLCQLFGRRDECDDPASKNFVPPAARKIHGLTNRQISPWPALPRPNAHTESLARQRAATLAPAGNAATRSLKVTES